MEQWEAVIDACPTQLDLRYFNKAVQTAGVVFKEDLAHFEKEWILQTLLYKPVDLLAIVASKRADDGWSKPIADAFKRLAELTEKHSEDVEPYFEDIVKTCLLPLDAQTRVQALACLISVAAVSACAAADVGRHIAHLEEGTSGKAPTALLIGTICEHHPETVEKDINKIWRLFLNLLDSNKNTDTITLRLLQGILGIFKHFGTDLPIAELGGFYEKLVGDYIRIARCEDVCLKILTDHAHLFRERISKDIRVRNYLWRHLHDSSSWPVNGIQAVMSVYRSMCGCLLKEQLQSIVTTELLPQTLSHRSQVKYTALRILTYIQTNCGINIEVDAQTDGQTLEVELREANVSYDVANKLSWYVESRLPGSDNLLQTAMLFYENLPDNKRKEIVVHGILNAKDELRSAAIKFLITESTQNPTSLETHQTLWKDLFDTDNGKDYIVLDKSKFVFEELMSYAIFVLEVFLEEGVEKLPEKLLTLLQLTSQVLTCQPQEDYTNDYCIVLLPLLTHLLKLSPDAISMVTARCAVGHITEPADNLDILKELYQVIRIDRCKDEALLCESCLALIQATTEAVDTHNILKALQITFSRDDVEPQVLSKALKKLENMIVSEKDKLDFGALNNIIHCVEKLQLRKDLSGKEGRILHRDVLMFIGKYGNRRDVNNNSDTTIIVKLMDSLTLNIVNPEEGKSYKLNLQGILQLALEHEEPNSLQTLLVIICANLATKKEECLQLALTRVCAALASSHARGAAVDPSALQAAVSMCGTGNCVQGLLKYISSAASPGVRKMLSDALETLLVADRNIEHEDTLSQAVSEYATVLMNTTDSTSKRAGLNITETLISSLKEKNALTKTLLPDLLILISKTFEIDSETTFEIGSKLFLDKIELFDQNDKDTLLRSLLAILLLEREKKMTELDVRIFKNTTKMILEFVKSVVDYKKENSAKVGEVIFEIIEKDSYDFENSLFLLAKYKEIFGDVSDLNSEFLNKLFDTKLFMEEPYFNMEAVLIFLQEYADNLLDLHYQTTLQLVARIITGLTPQCIKHVHRAVKSCLSVYTKKTVSSLLFTAFQTWCSKLPVAEITNSIEKESFTTAHSIMVFALKVMLQIFDPKPLVDLAVFAEKWSKILLKLFAKEYVTKNLKSKMSYLTDLLTVSLKFTSTMDIKKLILEGSTLDGLPTEKVGVQFCRFFMHVLYDKLVEKPHVLLDEDMKQCSILLNDVVRFTLKKKSTDEHYDTVLELVDTLWPTYEVEATFDQKHSLLVDMTNLPKKLARESNPMRWAVNNIVYSEASREEKARLVGVLPGGHTYSEAYRSFASTLPTRLSELKGECGASFRALLDALASTGDPTLLSMVVTLAGGGDAAGWWDDAIPACMAALATRDDMELCQTLYTRSKGDISRGVYRRMLIPLLRYSSSRFNEEFFSTFLDELRTVEVKQPSNHPGYHKRIIEYTRLCDILQVAFEKIPIQSLESPNSVLYRNVDFSTIKSPSWHLVRETCKLCHNLRKVKIPNDADNKFKEDFRQFQCASYNCYAAAICKRRPDGDKFYQPLFDITTWDNIVDSAKKYHLFIRQQWNQRTKRQPVSIDVESAPTSGLASLSASRGTVRSRMFLRTLSENPLMYDLIEDSKDEEIKTQDIQLPSNELNSHECSATITALLCHVTNLPHTTWVNLLVEGLNACHKNAKWLLAQMICNCKEELKPHASVLRSALLEVVANTALERNEKMVLNGLHVDILETLVHWGDETPAPSNTLDSCMELLVTTCLENRRQKIFRTLVDVLTKLLGLYASVVHLALSVYEPYLADSETTKTLQILQRVTKSKVNIPSLLPTLMEKLEEKKYQLSIIAELIGLALNACRDKQPFLIRFRKVLDQVRRTNAAEYIKMLYYAQTGCAQICDEYNFRMTTSLSQEVSGAEKTKSLRILSTFIATSTSQYISELYETIDLAELITEESIEAFNLVKEGVHVMQENVKKRLLLIIARYCEHAKPVLRRAACEVMLKGFEDLFNRPDEPSAKKPKTTTTPLISKVLSKDVYVTSILNALSCGVTDKDSEICSMVREGVAKKLHKDMGIRFAECFFITIYLSSNNKSLNMSDCVYALLDMLLMELRGQQRFKGLALRDEPLEIRSDTSSSKLLTMSRTYQGTFRRRTMLTSRNRRQIQAESTQRGTAINVQISIESILNNFMQFSKDTPEACTALCLQLVKTIVPSIDLAPELAKALSAILDRGVNDLTPFVVELSRIFVDELCKIDGIEATVQKLHTATKNTEGEHITRLLLQDVRLRCNGHEQFVLGGVDDSFDDVAMATDEKNEFHIDDLTSIFGKLSNWDTLTLQQKRRIQNNGLPPLWTDRETFRQQLDRYTPSTDWFGKMAAAYKQEQKRDVIKWLRGMDKWPRHYFQMSAITEAIEWQERKESNLLPCDIHPSDCLAEWAARLMIR
ncbi:hypothetical protein NE865_06853 [Phthorimaea operculella]|nr:hypothetical protein NE865_06853 [Phthorimaea operculella]